MGPMHVLTGACGHNVFISEKADVIPYMGPIHIGGGKYGNENYNGTNDSHGHIRVCIFNYKINQTY